VSVAFLDAFLAECMPDLDPAMATTSEVCELVVKRVWLSGDPSFSSLSLANLVQAGRVPGVKPVPLFYSRVVMERSFLFWEPCLLTVFVVWEWRRGDSRLQHIAATQALFLIQGWTHP